MSGEHLQGSALPLRPHHGMCMAYFVGHGYSGGFTAHMGALLASLGPESPVRLVVGTDAVCGACPNNLDGLCDKPELVASYDRAVLSLCGLGEGDELPFGQFTALVEEHILSQGRRASICGDCQWNALCASQKSRWGQCRPAR